MTAAKPAVCWQCFFAMRRERCLFDVTDAEAVLKLAKLPPDLQMAFLNASKKSNEARKV